MLFRSAGIGGALYGKGESITISDGKVTAKGSKGGAGIGGGGNNAKGGTIIIKGGTVKAETVGSYSENLGGGAGIGGGFKGIGDVITISNGSVTAKGDEGGAGIGNGSQADGSGKVTISGGTIVKAEGGILGAGIGGGLRDFTDEGSINDCEIGISGAAIISSALGGGGGAGVGGGAYGHGGTIAISGGTITAEGGKSAHHAGMDVDVWGGAGIGGGMNAAGGNITISGGTVKATGNKSAAGIGGGLNGAGGTIAISGGNSIKAYGGENGAGIGSGKGCTDNSSANEITITGGKISEVIGGYFAAGIGSGYQSVKCTVTISDGTISQATGGTWAAGIGNGVASAGCTLTISGGTVNATGGESGAGIASGNNGSITLTWTDQTRDTIAVTASGYTGTVKTGQRFYYEADGVLHSVEVANQVDSTTVSQFANRTLKALTGCLINVDGSIQHGSVTVVGGQPFADAGTPITLTVVPDEGYVLDDLTVKGANKTATPVQVDATTWTFDMIDEDVTVSAVFAVPHQVIIPGDIPHGSITSDHDQATADKLITLTISPDEGYALRELTVTSGGQEITLEEVDATHWTFIMEDDDACVSAKFRSGIKHNVIVADDIENGTVTPDLTEQEEDEPVTLTVAPVTGYYLTELTVRQSDDENKGKNS